MALLLTEIDLKEIVVDPNFNPRFCDYVYTYLGLLQESIAQQGMVVPITVQEIGNKFYLIDGYARYLACKALGYATMRCHVIDATPEQFHESLSSLPKEEDDDT